MVPRRSRSCSGRQERQERQEREWAQATVEFALVLPFVCLLLWVIVESALLLRSEILTTNAAREGARAAAIGASDREVREKTLAALPHHDGVGIEVETSGVEGDAARVQVSYPIARDLPLVRRVFPDLATTATASMRIEGPPFATLPDP